ncbi:hypothetical protein MRB53_030073 [Persea americana]|uniref:Uncharacterized protein n=1 Tax=Persea americana TaxID=3435 RepID=A0ACC2KK38_PERAE|nr:hypothetical protein MRB53_030073 [Persea americana]
MENSWRYRPVQGGNLCPTCSIPHFPFCPQPPPASAAAAAFDRIGIGFGRDNPHHHHHHHHQRFRFPPPLDPNHHPTLLHRPSSYDPFPNNRPLSSHFDLHSNHSNSNSNPFPNNRSMLEEREAMMHFDLGRSGGGGFFREQFDERYHHKRAKLLDDADADADDVGLSSFTQIPPPPPQLPIHNDYSPNAAAAAARQIISSDDQRLLDLIRNHGAQTQPLPQAGIGMGSTLESGRNFGMGNQGIADRTQRFEHDYQTDRLSHGSLIQDRRLGGDFLDAGSLSFLGSSSVGRQGAALPPDQIAFNQRNHSMQMQMNAYCEDQGFPRSSPYSQNNNMDRLAPIPNERYEFRASTSGDFKIGSEQQQQTNNGERFPPEMDYALRNRNREEVNYNYSALSQHDNMDGCHHAQNYRPGDIGTGATNYVESFHYQSGQDSLANYRDNCLNQGSHENYHAYDHPPLPSKDISSAVPGNQPQYPPHTALWQAANVQQQDQRGSLLPLANNLSNILPPPPVYPMQNQVESKHEFCEQQNVVRPFDRKALPLENFQNHVKPEKPDARNTNRGGYSFLPTGSSITSSMPGHGQASQAFGIHPPFPPLPPQPPSKEQSRPSPPHIQPASLPSTTPLYPVPFNSSATVPSSTPPATQGFPDVQSSSHAYFTKPPLAHPSSGFAADGSQSILQASSKQYEEGGQSFLSKYSPPDKLKVIDAAHLFRLPHRMNRPDHIVVILRGLPGSGKSYLAKVLRDLEVENGGNAPRIHSMDDYFMTEVEKVEDIEGSKSASLCKGKKRIAKKVMEYCYEPEMEEAYRSSMLKSFKKTLEEGIFTFIIVDDRNLRVADFAQFWAIAKRSGYEVYLLEATYKDPIGCAARNVHGFTSDDIQKMADQWEEAPPLYLQLDVQSLFRGDDLNEHNIQEVDMDMEDAASDEDGISGVQERKVVGTTEQPSANYAPSDSLRAGESWDAERDDPTEGIKELRRSKWSEDVDEDIEQTEGVKRNSNALSGLIQAYSKGGKSVCWGDQVGNSGFSIGAAKKTQISSLLIGPGAGYNLGSNPLPEDHADAIGKSNSTEPKKRTAFLEQLRAERESFRAVFDRRRQRIGGLDVDED